MICEGSHAHLEHNLISANLKANVSIGPSKNQTILLHNKINFARGEGIFLLGGHARIYHNEIYKNQTGIVGVNCWAQLFKTRVFENRDNGILLLKKSRLVMLNSQSTKNGGVGLYLRDDVIGVLRHNEIVSNDIDVLIEKPCELQKTLKDNTLGKNLRVPKKNFCAIF